MLQCVYLLFTVHTNRTTYLPWYAVVYTKSLCSSLYR